MSIRFGEVMPPSKQICYEAQDITFSLLRLKQISFTSVER